MPAVRTEYILTKLDGEVLGEIVGASGAQVALPHLRLHTAQIVLPIWHPRAEDVLSQDTILRVYRTDQLGARRITFAGPVISVEENGAENGQSIAVNAVSPFWRLTKRLLGTTKAGYALGTPEAPVDLGLMMHTILDTVNGQGYTGLSKGNLTNSNAGVMAQDWMVNAAERMAALAASINGPEYGVRYTDPVSYPNGAAHPQLAVLDVAPVIGGVTRSDAIFEYGSGKANVASYQRSRTLDGVLTRAFISVQGWPDGTTQDVRSMTADTLASRGLYEELVPDGGITDDTLRDSLLSAHLDVRKSWKQLITFTPSVNTRPGFQTDYNVGDYVRARAVVKGKVRFDAFFRVWGVTLSYDDNGNETAELELLPQAAGG